jgi:hypothetical protein
MTPEEAKARAAEIEAQIEMRRIVERSIPEGSEITLTGPSVQALEAELRVIREIADSTPELAEKAKEREEQVKEAGDLIQEADEHLRAEIEERSHEQKAPDLGQAQPPRPDHDHQTIATVEHPNAQPDLIPDNPSVNAVNLAVGLVVAAKAFHDVGEKVIDTGERMLDEASAKLERDLDSTREMAERHAKEQQDLETRIQRQTAAHETRHADKSVEERARLDKELQDAAERLRQEQIERQQMELQRHMELTNSFYDRAL